MPLPGERLHDRCERLRQELAAQLDVAPRVLAWGTTTRTRCFPATSRGPRRRSSADRWRYDSKAEPALGPTTTRAGAGETCSTPPVLCPRATSEFRRPAGIAPTSSLRRLARTVEEAVAPLGIGRALAYEAGRREAIRSIRSGRRVLVRRVALDRLLGGAGEARPTPTELDWACLWHRSTTSPTIRIPPGTSE